MKEGEKGGGGLTNLTNVCSINFCCRLVGLLVVSIFIVSFIKCDCHCCVLSVSSRDSDVKCTLDAVLGRGVGGHITLCISRAGVG